MLDAEHTALLGSESLKAAIDDVLDRQKPENSAQGLTDEATEALKLLREALRGCRPEKGPQPASEGKRAGQPGLAPGSSLGSVAIRSGPGVILKGAIVGGSGATSEVSLVPNKICMLGA